MYTILKLDRSLSTSDLDYKIYTELEGAVHVVKYPTILLLYISVINHVEISSIRKILHIIRAANSRASYLAGLFCCFHPVQSCGSGDRAGRGSGTPR